MKTDDIRKMGLAYVQVLEANKKTNKHGHDVVGHEDDDIDNDGDVDKSDSYLHNRRKAIKANMKKEEVEQVDESNDPRRVRDELKSQGKHKEAGEHAYKHGLGRSYGPHFGMRSSKNSAEMEFHKGYDHAKAREDRAARLKNEEVEQSKWPIYSRILEKRDMHVKGATPPEPIDSKASKGEKDFVNMHGGLNGNDSGIDGAKAAADTAKAAAAQVKVSPKRPNDQTIGDKTMPKPKG